MRDVATWRVLGLIAVFSLGCGSDAGPAGPVAVEDLCTQLTEALCRGIQGCCSVTRYASQAECISVKSSTCDSNIEPLILAGAAYVYDAAAATALVAEMRSAAVSCAVPPELSGARAVFEPAAKLGELCLDTDSCVDANATCSILENAESYTCELPVIGAFCYRAPECCTDCFCDNHVCVQKLADGTGCSSTSDRCLGVCEPESEDQSAPYVCAALRTNGIACQSANQCVSGYCRDNSCTACEADGDCFTAACVDGVCDPTVPPSPDNKPNGSSCRTPLECSSRFCRGGMCIEPTPDEIYCLY